MADSKISELTALTTPASDDVLAIVDTSAGVTKKITISNLATSSEVVDDTSPQLGGDLASNGSDILFADNDKAKFGTGNDLEIYHDGSNSYIEESNATGNLFIKGTHIVLQNSSGQDALNLINGNAFLKSGGNTVLETTSTGIDVTGTVTADGLTVDDITINGSTISDSGDLTLDIGGDITFDAGGADIILSDDGTIVGTLSFYSSDFLIRSRVSDKDILFKGNDGGSEITALTLDMSNNGKATFNSSVDVGNHLYLGDNKKAIFGAGEDLNIQSDGTNGQINAVNGTLTLDVAGDITLDSGGGSVFLKDDGAFIGQLSNSSSDFAIVALAQDKDIILKGNDGGSGITALTLDMSNAGRAVFNDGATFNNNVYLGDDDKLVFGGGADLQFMIEYYLLEINTW